MFAGFNLAIDLNSFKGMIEWDRYDFYFYKRHGESILANQKAECSGQLKQYVTDGITDGTKLESDWFPQVEADIFISHSHNDKDLASALAGWLDKKFNLKCFIDSHVWGYIDELLEEINKDHSDKQYNSSGGYTYDHKKCNIVASHVNMMLCMALQKMIDKTEAVFVLNTENSIKKYADIYDKSTYSPWIYSEIVCTQIVRSKKLSEYRKGENIIYYSESQAEINNSYQAAYEVSLDHLKDINTNKLIEWVQNWSNVKNKEDRYSLDELYKITYPKKVEKLISVHNSINSIILG